MKKIVIVHAHPEPASFCSSLMQTARNYFLQNGDQVDVIDLYKIGFNPVGGPDDFKSLSNKDYFKYQAEQLHAYENNLFNDDLKEQMNKLENCDVLVFNFPLWWFGLPAILKGWVDRVFAMGFVYGNGKGVYDSGIFKDKIAFATLTTGGPEVAYNGGKNGNLSQILFPINHGMFYFAGMKVLEPFVSFAPVRKSENEREGEIDRYIKFLSTIDDSKPIF